VKYADIIKKLKAEFDRKEGEIQQIDRDLRALIVKRPFRRQFSVLRDDYDPLAPSGTLEKLIGG
jgi:hypothetical protein